MKPLFFSLFQPLNQAGVINRYRSVNQTSLLASLILLVFLVHTTLEWMDDKYQLLR